MNKGLLMIRGLGSERKSNRIFGIIAVLVSVAIIATGVVSASYSNEVNKGLADNLIRLHVIANSDTAEDQALKRDVRDAVLNYMKGLLKASRDIEQTKFIINRDMGKIEDISKKVITGKGKNYAVSIKMGSYPFPTKTYGDIALPAGIYQALRIVIGKGEGANWWCVLFPPLCFVDATHGTVPDSVKSQLKDVLSDDQYKIVTSSDNEKDIPVKVKFKTVELFQKSKMKISGVFNKLLSMLW